MDPEISYKTCLKNCRHIFFCGMDPEIFSGKGTSGEETKRWGENLDVLVKKKLGPAYFLNTGDRNTLNFVRPKNLILKSTRGPWATSLT